MSGVSHSKWHEASLRRIANNVTQEQWQQFLSGHADYATTEKICNFVENSMDMCSQSTGVELTFCQYTPVANRKTVVPKETETAPERDSRFKKKCKKLYACLCMCGMLTPNTDDSDMEEPTRVPAVISQEQMVKPWTQVSFSNHHSRKKWIIS